MQAIQEITKAHLTFDADEFEEHVAKAHEQLEEFAEFRRAEFAAATDMREAIESRRRFTT